MKYRKEIDGLRGIAIILVILFHAGYEFADGGYIGVDIFFVISGYLITTIIIEDFDKGKFSFLFFYERRIRRLFPALFTVFLFCIICAWTLMTQKELSSFGYSLSAASLFFSNFFFWHEVNYFMTEESFTPLLHTWSLAIEEQFYLIFPILFLALLKIKKIKIQYFIAFGVLLSFFLASVYSKKSLSAGFYLTPMRAWEIGVGSIISIYLYRINFSTTSIVNNRKFSELMSIIGVLLFILGLYVASKTKRTPQFALLPVLGTSFLIIFSGRSVYLKRMLSFRWLVFIGLISYSLYLWHYSLFTFYKWAMPSDYDQSNYFLLIILSILIAIFSWRYVEAPFRRRDFLSQRAIFGMGFFVVGFISLAGILFGRSVIPPRTILPSNIQLSFNIDTKDHCLRDVLKKRYWQCYLGAKKDSIDAVVYGDSHAIGFKTVFDKLAIESNKRILFVGGFGCSPVLSYPSVQLGSQSKHCLKNHKYVDDLIQEKQVKKILWIARWALYVDSSYTSYNNSRYRSSNKRERFRNDLQEAIDYYKNMQIELTAFSQVPHHKIKPERLYHYLYRLSNSSKRQNYFNEKQLSYDAFNKLQEATLKSFQKHKEKLTFVRLDKYFCKQVCLIGTLNKSFYYDQDHLSADGGLYLESVVRDYLK